MLASEFSDSTLNQQGSGEFDPMFIITKLGAKVNRVIVAGMLERLDPVRHRMALRCGKDNSETPRPALLLRRRLCSRIHERVDNTTVIKN